LRECPEVVYNLRDLFSSRTGFTVPDRCEAWLDLHIPPSTPMGQMASDLEEVFARAFRKYAHLQGHFRIITIDPGYELPERGRIVELLKKACGNRSLGWKPEPFRSHSDANQLWAAGIKPLLLGAGRLESSHVPEESVSFQDVCLAAGVYYDLLSSVAPARVKRSS
jgi:acetylornithine deacetylase